MNYDDTTILDEISLVKLDRRHLQGGLKLSQEFSWPYRLEDWAFALEVGDGVVLERNGEVLGTALWWCYGQDYATAGMIIVTEKAQGGGNGSRLFDALLQATRGRNVLLNATEEGLPLYLRRGFERWGMVHQHQCLLNEEYTPKHRDDIRDAVARDFDSIQALDHRAIGMPRGTLVKALLNVGDAIVLERDGQISGFSIRRRFGRGYVVGPVAADNIEDAKCLIEAQLAKLTGEFVRIDVYAEDGLSEWLEERGLKQVSEAISMVKGVRPAPIAPTHMYAVANQSFS
ncbi:GNAT family N-acetyltransferase [Rhizobium oryziradicis]|uniref:GNAT family N-acetyltransferase n=1 Tax=Rhizobium oryziradicis TaxID=1867956 RepID=A0A1Q8ZM80_9HYPH|nr:GNAT family N-acetyltransferase [Rhizobium oryziradicis]OLP43011.1 GNAT family N-acetyltransferase [Rhizobium oryziradicis]